MREIKIPKLRQLENMSKIISKVEKISTKLEPTLKLGSSINEMYSNPVLGKALETSRLISTKLEPTLKLGSSINEIYSNPVLGKALETSRLISTKLEPTMNLGSIISKRYSTSILKQMKETSELISVRIKTLDLDSKNLNSLASELFEKQSLFEIEESIKSKSIKNEIIEGIFEVFPEIKETKNALSKNEYIKLTIYLVRIFFIYYMAFTGFLNTLDINEPRNYIINGNDVRVRTEPSTENSKSILTKLHNNHYVRKVDENADWFKVEFKTKENEVLSGWVYIDYLKEIED